jgi:hypothetical protein
MKPEILVAILSATEEYGILPALLGLAALIVVIFWVIFPFIVISKANEIIRELKKISAAKSDSSPPPAPERK